MTADKKKGQYLKNTQIYNALCELMREELADFSDGIKSDILSEIRLAIANFNYEYAKKMEELKRLSHQLCAIKDTKQ